MHSTRSGSPPLCSRQRPRAKLTRPLAFAIGATELFAATVLCGWVNGFAIGPSIAAGWLLTLMTWQLFGMPAIVTIWFFFPCHAEVLAVSTIMVSAALHLGEGPLRRSILLTGVIFLCLTYILLAIPTSLILTIPIAGMFTAAGLLLSAGRRRTADHHPVLGGNWIDRAGARLHPLSGWPSQLYRGRPVPRFVETGTHALWRRGQSPAVDANSLVLDALHLFAGAHNGRRGPDRQSDRNLAWLAATAAVGVGRCARRNVFRRHRSIELLAGLLVWAVYLVFRALSLSLFRPVHLLSPACPADGRLACRRPIDLVDDATTVSPLCQCCELRSCFRLRSL